MMIPMLLLDIKKSKKIFFEIKYTPKLDQNIKNYLPILYRNDIQVLDCLIVRNLPDWY